MLSAHQIFRDSKENVLTSVAKDRKLNSADNHKNADLTISTNIYCETKSNPDSVEKSKKESSPTMKSCPEIEVKNQEDVLKETKKSEDVKVCPEIENMYIYKGPKDEYEEDIPEDLGLTKDELDIYDGTGCLERFDRTENYILEFRVDDEGEDIIPEDLGLPRDELDFFDGTSYVGRIINETAEKEAILNFTLDFSDFHTPPSPPVP
ncbi:uncharacterized protein [Parasteatoda tepidariorum]|uniref:uncharacterized protein n=1 Tax=Parasteatoda tepidariorum TaxID=114398 RepID=UPI001C7222B1|nr:uncharacterized protein LOC107454704 [Parasteatoda tepidariorum]XP_042897368.1 uncharacterized protein LOC107454704 [Parasteatoda tepidariorum]XP_042897369.1 uncharacterized protein LOC107454704 [Parasteatoda tepidariorum]